MGHLPQADSSDLPAIATHAGIFAAIDFQINNFTALPVCVRTRTDRSVEILDDVLPCTPYSNFSLWPCGI